MHIGLEAHAAEPVMSPTAKSAAIPWCEHRRFSRNPSSAAGVRTLAGVRAVRRFGDRRTCGGRSRLGSLRYHPVSRPRERKPFVRIALGLVLFLFFAGFRACGAAFHLPSAGAPQPPGSNGLPQAQLQVQQIGPNTFRVGRVEFDKALRTVFIPARVRMLKEVVEYALVTEQGKTYESLLMTDARPVDIHVACLLLGLGQAPVEGQPNQPAPLAKTNSVTIEVTWHVDGKLLRVELADLVCLTSGRPDPDAPPMKLAAWLYNGSFIDSSGFAAQREGSIISLIRDPVALVNNPAPDRDKDTIHFPNVKLLPPEGTAITVLLHCGEARTNVTDKLIRKTKP